MSHKKRILFNVIAVFMVVLVSELLLNALCLVSTKIQRILLSPWIAIPADLPDKRLGYRLNPVHPEHDRNGYRNPNVPRSAEIVALGDSQTYGEGVKPPEAWPRQLEAISGHRVYGMAVGGYGPAHSLKLWNDAMVFRPNIVIEALYEGNDLYDSYDLVYYKNQLPEFKNTDKVIQEKIKELERMETIEHRVEQMYNMGKPATDEQTGPKPPFPIDVLSRHSKVYGLLRRVFYELGHHEVAALYEKPESWENAKKNAEKNPQYCQLFDNGRFKTVFTSEYRLTALDQNDPRVKEGQSILLKSIETMNELAKKRGIRFLVILIPTKEYVFRELVNAPLLSYSLLMSNEDKFRSAAFEYFNEHHIEYLDILPAFRYQLDNGIQPYQITIDGHPNKFGHSAIAVTINTRLAGVYE